MRRSAIGKLARCLALVLFAGALTAGCNDGQGGLLGYTAEELYPENVGTVSVEIFGNRTFQQGVEFHMTEALIKEVELRTPYKVVARGKADTAITGNVLAVQRRVLSRTFEAGIPQEVQVVVTVEFEWKDLRSGEVLRKRASIQGTGEFVPVTNYPDHIVSEPYDIAQHEAAAELARDIVSLMRRDW